LYKSRNPGFYNKGRTFHNIIRPYMEYLNV